MDSGSLEYNIICVKWGDKFSSEHVNRLYRMAKKNISLPFNFYCWTEDASGIYDEINIVPLDEMLDLKAWWWKLTLFKENNLNGINLFLDLDVVIQDNIDHLFDFAQHDKLALIDRSFEDTFETIMNDDRANPTMAMYNSSIMVWYNNENIDIYEKFVSNINLYTAAYIGIDRFFTYEILSSKFTEIDNNNYYYRAQSCSIFSNVDKRYNIEVDIDGQKHIMNLYYDPDKPICVFNGSHEDYFYTGMGHYLL